MTPTTGSPRVRSRHPLVRASATVGAAAAMVIGVALTQSTSASAAQAPVGLGTAAPFAVLAGTTITNTGATVISGDVGLSPGSAITGFPPGLVTNGTVQTADATAVQAQSSLATAYIDAADRTPATPVSTDLGGLTLTPGVYQSAAAMSLTGTVTLDAQNNPNAVFVLQTGSTLTTASSSTVDLIGGAQACNVFWQVGSSATLGTSTTFAGSILALTSASVETGATIAGRVLVRNGAVTLDDNVVDVPSCTTGTTSTGTTSTGTTSTGTTSTGTTSTGTTSTGTTSTGTTSTGTTSTGTTSAVPVSTGPTPTVPSSTATTPPTSSAAVPVGLAGSLGGGTGAAPSVVAGATTVHTGEPWAGSHWYDETIAALGIGLVALGFRRRRHTNSA